MAFFFPVRQWEGTPENPEPDKCTELRWVPLDALPTYLIDYCRAALKHISDGQFFSVYGW